jgi:hypothetical protein
MVPGVEVVDDVVNEAIDQVDEPDQPDAAPPPPPPPQSHPLPPHHALNTTEAHWPETARLVHPARGGKLALLAQNNSIQAVIQDSIPLVFHHIASVNSFPSGGDKVKLIRDCLYQAAETEGFDDIANRLSQDRNFGRSLSSLVRASFLFPSTLSFTGPSVG